ncbi:recombinase family protein [Natronomonas marina]|uniref:recombinase family protein n=1 Tax=Natronomonas marina TaxID=2961939 RepID=UPI0020C9F297|nr:recombinase family protein [Natronomonas marina]
MTVGCYVRVSTADQNLDRQLEATSEYATDELGTGLANVETYRDKSTGTDTDRSGYRQLMNDVEAGEIGTVVVHDTTRLTRSLQDLDRTVERITEAGGELHFVRDNLPPFSGDDDPMARLMLQMLGAFAEWEARVKQRNTREGIAARRADDDEYHHGPAPLGFEKDDGHLIEGDDYHQVVAVLDMVQKGELSKRKAAARLDCGRATVSRALDRAELYGI